MVINPPDAPYRITVNFSVDDQPGAAITLLSSGAPCPASASPFVIMFLPFTLAETVGAGVNGGSVGLGAPPAEEAALADDELEALDALDEAVVGRAEDVLEDELEEFFASTVAIAVPATLAADVSAGAACRLTRLPISQPRAKRTETRMARMVVRRVISFPPWVIVICSRR